ncbi:MAG: hypothetical protein GDA36_10345 [Rhodobacteraceae bacterium]|nr:hypothetical protein [Paracoccaceae bacterium]
MVRQRHTGGAYVEHGHALDDRLPPGLDALVDVPLQNKFEKVYEYSDCGIGDSRLFALNMRKALAHGAGLLTHGPARQGSQDML